MGERYSDLLIVLALIVILLFLLTQYTPQDKAEKGNIPIITIVLSISLFISAIVIYSSHKSKARDLKNETITLEEFQKYKPIDFDKFPEWARDDLAEKGKLYYIDVREAINEQEDEKNRMKKLERIEKRKELMNSMSK